MMKKTLVLLSSVLAGALLVGGAFAAYSIVDNAEMIGITTTPGTLTPEGTLTLDWGEHEQAIVDGSRLDGLLPGQPQKAGVLVLQAEYDENTQLTYYDGTLAVNFIDANEQEKADKFIDFLNIKVYEGAIDEIGEAEPAAQALLGKAANLKLRGTKAGVPYTVFVELDATAASILDNIQEDEAQITFDWGKYVEPAPEPREASGHTIRYGGATIDLYEDENYDPATDEWGGIAKFISDPFDVTVDYSIVVYNLDEEAIYANSYYSENNVKTTTPEDPTTYQIRATAKDAVLSLYQYEDGWAFILSGYTGGDEPVVSGAKIGIGPAGNWESVKFVALTPNPDTEGELMAEGVELAEGDLFYIDFGDGEHYLHYPQLEDAGAAACFEDAGGNDHNLRVVVAGTYDIYATTAKIYIGVPNAE